MAADNPEGHSQADLRWRARRASQLAILSIIFGVAALPLWLLYQQWTHPALFWIAAVVSFLTGVFLVSEYAVAAAPQLSRLRRLFSR